MKMNRNLILIDENNFFFRCFWSQKLTAGTRRVEVVYAIFRNLRFTIEAIRAHSGVIDDVVVFAGDRGYRRRFEASQKAFDDGVIPMTYKSARRERHKLQQESMCDEEIAEEEEKREQLRLFDELCNKTRIVRAFADGEEADDVIASYCSKYGKDFNIYIVSTDGDYLQLLGDSITIYNPQKNTFITGRDFVSDWGFEPVNFIDYGAIVGDGGDSICGVPGFGPARAKPFVQKYKTIETMLAELGSRSPETVDEMRKYRTFDEFRQNVHQTAYSLYEAKLLFHSELLKVAKYLKGMFHDVEIPVPENRKSSEQELENEFKSLNFVSILKYIDYFTFEPMSDERRNRIVRMVQKPLMVYRCRTCGKEYVLQAGQQPEHCSCGGELEGNVQNFIEQTRFF